MWRVGVRAHRARVNLTRISPASHLDLGWISAVSRQASTVLCEYLRRLRRLKGAAAAYHDGGGGGYGGGGGGGGFVLGGEEEETRRRGGEREVRSVKERPRRAVAPSLSLLEATARAAATLAAFSCEASPAAAEAKLVEGGAVGGCGGLVRAARPSPAAWVRKEEALPPVAVAVVGALAFALRELKTRARPCACVREGWTRRHKAT